MIHQPGAVGKPGIAKMASKRLFASVDPLVHHQLVFHWERGPTHIADIRSFSGVASHVSNQMGFLRELQSRRVG